MAIVESALAQMPEGRRGNSLADVLGLILDKGLVIDAFVRVSVIGIELVTVDARIVIASIDTYLKFAEAVNRLDLTQTKESTTYEDLVRGGSKQLSEGGTKGVIEGIKEEMPGKGGGEDDDEPSTSPGDEPSTASGKNPSDSDEDEGRDQEEEGNDQEDDGGKGPLKRLAKRARYS